MAGLKIGLHGPDQGGAFHGGQEMAEEALLRSLESRQRGGLGVLVQCPSEKLLNHMSRM